MEDHNLIKVHVKRAHTSKIFRLSEEFGTDSVKTLNLALSIGLAKIDQDLRHKPTSRYLKKFTSLREVRV